MVCMLVALLAWGFTCLLVCLLAGYRLLDCCFFCLLFYLLAGFLACSSTFAWLLVCLSLIAGLLATGSLLAAAAWLPTFWFAWFRLFVCALVGWLLCLVAAFKLLGCWCSVAGLLGCFNLPEPRSSEALAFPARPRLPRSPGDLSRNCQFTNYCD